MSEFLRPNLISIDRRSAMAPSVTGARAPQTTNLNNNVPALIDFGLTGTETFQIDGLTFVQEAMLFIDGLKPYQFIGVPPGGTIVVDGVTYTVAANGLGAYPDIGRGDRVTDEVGQNYLALSVATYYDVIVSREVKLSIGKDWA